MLFTEMVLIVASILLAFALDSWWQDRKDAQEEVRLLQGLQEEFRQNRQTLEYYLEFNQRGIQQLAALTDAANSGHWRQGPVSPDKALEGLVIPPTSDLGSGVLSTLITSGRLDLLRDQVLRNRLAAWNGIYSELQDDELLARQFVFDTVLPYLVDMGVPLRGPLSTAGQWPTETRATDTDPARYQRLLDDPRFATLVDIRLAYRIHTSKEFQQVMEMVDGILADIERSLAAR